MSYLFTSESVTEGHPDKICDQVSDAILDAMLEQDPMSRVACETLTNTGFVMVMGEITTKANVDIPAIVRKTITDIGYVLSWFHLTSSHLILQWELIRLLRLRRTRCPMRR